MLKFTKGGYKQFAIQFPAGTDLTGCTVLFTAKRESDVNTDDPNDDLAVIKARESAHDHPEADPTNGRTVMTVEASDVTGPVGENYRCDFKLIDSAGKAHYYKKTSGDLLKCEITPRSTQRTS